MTSDLRFTLSYRDVEGLLAERGLDVSYETVRGVLKFDPLIARKLRQGRPRPSARWHLDGVSRTHLPNSRGGTMREMRVGPSAPVVRCMRQTTAMSSCG
jgi:hypothetical protein